MMSCSWKAVSALVQGSFVVLKWILLVVLMYWFGLQSFCCCMQIRSFGLVSCNRSLFLVYAHGVNDPNYWVPLKPVTLLSHDLYNIFLNILSILFVMLSVALIGQKRRKGQWWQSLCLPRCCSMVVPWAAVKYSFFSLSWERWNLWWLDSLAAVGRGCALQ